MKLVSSRRRKLLLVGCLTISICAAIWAWTIVTPKIGEPSQGPTAAGTAQTPPAPTKLWSFGFVGDTHAGLADGTIERIFASFQAANLEFVLHLGDMVDVGASNAQWEQLAGLVSKHELRLMPVVGNHDVHRGYASDRGEIRFRQYFPQLPDTFYAFQHRGLSFLMLNSERSLLPGSEQARFVAEHLNQSPGSTIVCLHRPVFTCGKRDLAFVMGRRLCLHRALMDTDAVCVLTGHNHYYERTRPLDEVTYLVSGGGTANQYVTDLPNSRTAKLVAGQGHYGLVDVYDDHLAVRAVGLDGQELDNFRLPLKARREKGKSYETAWGCELPPMASLRSPTLQLRDEPSPMTTRAADTRSGGSGNMPRLW